MAGQESSMKTWLKAMKEVPEIRNIALQLLANLQDMTECISLAFANFEQLWMESDSPRVRRYPRHIMHRIEEVLDFFGKIKENRTSLIAAIDSHLVSRATMSDELQFQHIPEYVQFVDETILDENFYRLCLELKEQLFFLVEIEIWNELKEYTNALSEYRMNLYFYTYDLDTVCRDCGFCNELDESDDEQ